MECDVASFWLSCTLSYAILAAVAYCIIAARVLFEMI